MLTFALAYARAGWPVFPCRPRDKPPLTRHGVKDATADGATITAWWTCWPNANIGLATGVAFDVLDIDGPDVELPGPLPDSPTVGTGKGLHIYLPVTGLGNRAGMVPGVDYRGVGGYILAPPSVHPSGAVYQWLASPRLPLAEPPTWLTKLLRPGTPIPVRAEVVRLGAYAQRALDDEVSKVRNAVSGTRNHTLNKAAYSLGQLIGERVLDAEPVVSSLLAAAIEAGLGQHESEATITSGLRAGLNNPRVIEPRR